MTRLAAAASAIGIRPYLLFSALLAAAALTGCGSSSAVTVTATVPSASTQSADTSAASTTPTSATPSPASAYPVVHFTITATAPTTNQVGIWPFTAQFVSITENPNGFPSSNTIPPQDTYLMVQVAITSQITGRMTAVPEPAVSCHAPNDRTWSYQGNDGYDQGSTSPDPQGDSIPLGDGQPHLWDAEWEVPEGTSTTDVKCILEGGTNDHITGSGKLN